jgi:hypothetical protein
MLINFTKSGIEISLERDISVYVAYTILIFGMTIKSIIS